MSTLRFARRLADFESAVNREASLYFPGNESSRSLAQSYVALLKGLIKVDEEYPEAGIPDLLSDVIGVYEQGEADLRNRQDAEDARREREHAEAERRHERVVHVECPGCHAPADAECRSRNGSSLGINDHKARVRAATVG